MNVNEAKNILLLYRPGTADAEDPQTAEALMLAKHDPELARWLEAHCARQSVLGEKFRQIPVPAGLKEQIISEHAAHARINLWRPRVAMAAAAAVILLVVLASFLLRHRPGDDTLAVFQNQMAGLALRGYGMDLITNDPAKIRAYLAQNQAPADYVLPAALQNAAVVGCAVEGWQKGKVSMICFRTGWPLPPGQPSDLWLFVVDRASVKDAPTPGPPHIAAVNRLNTAIWTRGDKVYLLGIDGNQQTIRRFL